MEWTQALESVCLASEALKSDSFLDLNYEILTVEPQRNGTNSLLIQVAKPSVDISRYVSLVLWTGKCKSLLWNCLPTE